MIKRSVSLFGLALPLIIIGVLSNLPGQVARCLFAAASHPAESIAAHGAAWATLSPWLGCTERFLSVGAILVALNPKLAKNIFQHSVCLAILLGIISAGFIPIVEDVTRWHGHTASFAGEEAELVRYYLAAVAPGLLFCAVQNLLVGRCQNVLALLAAMQMTAHPLGRWTILNLYAAALNGALWWRWWFGPWQQQHGRTVREKGPPSLPQKN
jgi:hypothetical protein